MNQGGQRLCSSKTLIMLRMRSLIFSFSSLIFRSLERAEHSLGLELPFSSSQARWRVSATISGRSGFLAERSGSAGLILPASLEVQLGSFLMLPTQSLPTCGVRSRLSSRSSLSSRSLLSQGSISSLRSSTCCWQFLAGVILAGVMGGCGSYLQPALSFCIREYLLVISLRMSCLFLEGSSRPTGCSTTALSSRSALLGSKVYSNFRGVVSQERKSSVLGFVLTSASYLLGLDGQSTRQAGGCCGCCGCCGCWSCCSCVQLWAQLVAGAWQLGATRGCLSAQWWERQLLLPVWALPAGGGMPEGGMVEARQFSLMLLQFWPALGSWKAVSVLSEPMQFLSLLSRSSSRLLPNIANSQYYTHNSKTAHITAQTLYNSTSYTHNSLSKDLQMHHFFPPFDSFPLDFPLAFGKDSQFSFSLSDSGSSCSSSGSSMSGSYLTCFCCSFLPFVLAISRTSSCRLLQSRVSFPLVAPGISASGFGWPGAQTRAERCSPTMRGVMRYCSMSSTASSTASCLTMSEISRARTGAQRFLAAEELALAVAGKIAFLNSLARRFILRSLENLPSQAGNCGKPRLSLIFSVGQTQLRKPKEGISPHSCSFRMVRLSMSPIAMPFKPSTSRWKSAGEGAVLRAEASRFSWTMMGTMSLSMKKHSMRCWIFMALNSVRFMSLRAASKWLIITEASLALRARAVRASTVMRRETVLKMSSRQLSSWRMSFWKPSTSCSSARSSPLPPSAARISFSRRTTMPLCGLWNFTSRQCAASARIFSLPRSLQMQMMGTVVVLSLAMMAATPPRSPELMPSTSSMMISGRARLRKMSRLYDRLSSAATPLLFRTSLALNSVAEQLYSAASSRAVVVLPMPGSPLMSAAGELMFPPAFHPRASLTSRLLPRRWMSSQLSSHSRSAFIWLDSPITSSSRAGLYFSVHTRPSLRRPTPSPSVSSPAPAFACPPAIGKLRTWFLLMRSSSARPVLSVKKSSSSVKATMRMPRSRASLLFCVSAMGVLILRLKWSSTWEPCSSRLHFLVMDFGHSAPNCSQTSISLSLSIPSYPPVKAITRPASGPDFGYLEIDFVRFTSFFTEACFFTYLAYSFGSLLLTACLSCFRGTDYLMAGLVGSGFASSKAQSSRFSCLTEEAVRLSLRAISISFCSSCMLPLYCQQADMRLALRICASSERSSSSPAANSSLLFRGFFCSFLKRIVSSMVSWQRGFSLSLPSLSLPSLSLPSFSLPSLFDRPRSCSFSMKASRCAEPLARLGFLSYSAASRFFRKDSYFGSYPLPSSASASLTRQRLSSSPEGSSISSAGLISLSFFSLRFALPSGISSASSRLFCSSACLPLPSCLAVGPWLFLDIVYGASYLFISKSGLSPRTQQQVEAIAREPPSARNHQRIMALRLTAICAEHM